MIHREAGEEESTPREVEPVNTVADNMKGRVNGVNNAKSIKKAGSQCRECEQ